MPLSKQQSSILSEQELQFLASPVTPFKKCNNDFAIYSYRTKLLLPDCTVYLCDDFEQLLLLISASQRGSALVLPAFIESLPRLNRLIKFLNQRSDIQIFWLGKMPSMDVELPAFEHCLNEATLLQNIRFWQQRMKHVFNQWLAQYQVAFIEEDPVLKAEHLSSFKEIGLSQVEYFNGQSAENIVNAQLLIIDISVHELRLMDILNKLASRELFPIIILFAPLPENLCRATYKLAENYGFSILASLNFIPDNQQWRQLLLSLFCKVYLKHWINEAPAKSSAYGLYNLQTQQLESYFCRHGMSKKQIAALPKQGPVRKIITASSLKEWFPDGIKRELRSQLAADLNCELAEIDICMEHPQTIQTNSFFFSALVMARLSQIHIYWLVDNEAELSVDILKNFPVSDLILSQELTHQLLDNPSERLLDFIEQAKKEEIRLCISLTQNQMSNDLISLYGIEALLNEDDCIS